MEINLDDIDIVTYGDQDDSAVNGVADPIVIDNGVGIEDHIVVEPLSVHGMQNFVDTITAPPVTNLVIEDNAVPDDGEMDTVVNDPVDLGDPISSVDPSDIDEIDRITIENISLQLGLEDVSLLPTKDGYMPAEVNTQMAVIPVNDPTLPPSLDDLRDKMQLSELPDDSTTLDNMDLSEILVSNTAISGALASTGFDLTMATEQFGGDSTLLSTEEIDALEKLNVAIRDRSDELEEIRTVLIEQKGLDSDTAKRIEAIDKGLLSSKVSLETISRYPGLNGYAESLEALDHAIVIAKAAGAVAVFAIIIKLVLYIKKLLSGNTKATEKERNEVRQLRQRLVIELGRIDTDYKGEIRNNERLAEKFDALMKKHKLPVRLGQKSFVDINDGIMSSYIRANLESRYNQMMDRMITGDAAQRVTRTLIDGIGAVLPIVTSRFNELESKFKSNETLDPKSFIIDMAFIPQLEKIAGITSNSQDVNAKVTYIRDSMNKLLAKGNNTAAIPTYNRLIEFKYDIDGAFEFDDKVDKELRKMLTTVDKLRKEASQLNDASLAKNREECASNLKSTISSVVSLIVILVQVRDNANTLIKVLRSASVKATDDWAKTFSGTGITFKVN